MGQEPANPVQNIPAPGDLFVGKYEIERTLGVGGMGMVLAARHVQLGHRVAIKFMLGEMAANPSAVARFIREARAAAGLSSEHVARVMDVGTLEGGAPYMVMEYLAGVDLGEVLRRDGPMNIETAVGMVLQACDAIAEAHSTGIIHRDLKPSNLFLTARMDGSPLVKVLDFGVSKTRSGLGRAEDPSLTATGSVMGSPAYMSPEQVRSTKDVDCRADIWSLGVILYGLLTGIEPFTGQTLGDTFARIVADDPPPIREHRKDVPPGLAAIVAACLERKLDQRVQDVGELASRLLPFGPKDSAPLVESILRVLGRGAHAPTVLGDAGGPSVVKTSSPQSKKSSAAAQFSETGPPVLRAPSGLNVAGGKRSLVLVALGLVVVVAGALGLRARREIRSPASAPRLNDPVAASPSAASATPATSSDAGSAESVESISEADRLMNAQSDLNPLEPLREGPSPLPPTHRPMVSDPPARPVAPVPAARTPSSPTPSTKRHEIDVY